MAIMQKGGNVWIFLSSCIEKLPTKFLKMRSGTWSCGLLKAVISFPL